MNLYNATLYKLNEEVDSVFFKKMVNINSLLYDDYYKYLVNFKQSFEEPTQALFREILEVEKLFLNTNINIVVGVPYFSRYYYEIITGIKIPKLWIYDEGKKNQFYQISIRNRRVFARINNLLTIEELKQFREQLTTQEMNNIGKNINEIIINKESKNNTHKMLLKIKGDKI